MSHSKSIFAAVIASALVFAQAAHAAVVGIAIDPNTQTQVGQTEFRNVLGGDAIRYFIPLDASRGNGTYGVDDNGNYGLTPDTGSGGPTLSMYLLFSPISIGAAYNLDILFEDLDLAGANDPASFLETIEVLSADGTTSLSGPITNIGQPLVSGNGSTQLLSLFLGAISVDPFIVRLDFASSFTRVGTNTPEFLIASVEEVPLPAAAPLFMAGIAGIGFLRRRKQKAA